MRTQSGNGVLKSLALDQFHFALRSHKWAHMTVGERGLDSERFGDLRIENEGEPGGDSGQYITCLRKSQCICTSSGCDFFHFVQRRHEYLKS